MLRLDGLENLPHRDGGRGNAAGVQPPAPLPLGRLSYVIGGHWKRRKDYAADNLNDKKVEA